VARARKPAKYNLKSRVRSALRKVWQWSPHRREALARARVGFGRYECAECGDEFGPKEIAVDHVTPAGGFSDDLHDLGEFAHKLFFGELQILCHQHHDIKTAHERKARKARK
jgi:5-methylcytosine-specific restriction endonuclease McrA